MSPPSEKESISSFSMFSMLTEAASMSSRTEVSLTTDDSPRDVGLLRAICLTSRKGARPCLTILEKLVKVYLGQFWVTTGVILLLTVSYRLTPRTLQLKVVRIKLPEVRKHTFFQVII